MTQSFYVLLNTVNVFQCLENLPLFETPTVEPVNRNILSYNEYQQISLRNFHSELTYIFFNQLFCFYKYLHVPLRGMSSDRLYILSD
jgi:hypothetical protein